MVDRFANAAENAQGLPACPFDPVIALAQQRADRGRGGIENIDLVLVDDLPEAAEIGVIRHPSNTSVVAPLASGP